MNPEAVVIGRVGVDLNPGAPRVSLESAGAFSRTVGGYGGNVATGLARLGVRAAIVATVGDDGHGRFVRAFLEGEGVDTNGLRIDDGFRTPIAFFEAWPPDDFPVTFYPSPAYWAIGPSQLPDGLLRGARLAMVSATTLAAEPSRSIVLRALSLRHASLTSSQATVLDLDWRPALWSDPREAPSLVHDAIRHATVVIGSETEFAAVGLRSDDAVAVPAATVFLKRGASGARVVHEGSSYEVPPIEVNTLCGLGSGDAFAAAVGDGLCRGLPADRIGRRANAAGAIVATRMACSDAMPTEREIEDLLYATATASPGMWEAPTP